jgi:hypothetical protein
LLNGEIFDTLLEVRVLTGADEGNITGIDLIVPWDTNHLPQRPMRPKKSLCRWHIDERQVKFLEFIY